MLFTNICILALEIPISDEGDPREITARYRFSFVTSLQRLHPRRGTK